MMVMHFAFSLKQEKELGCGVRRAALGLGIIPQARCWDRVCEFVEHGPGKDRYHLGCCEADSDGVQRAESRRSPLPAPPQALRAEGRTRVLQGEKGRSPGPANGGHVGGRGGPGEAHGKKLCFISLP